MGFKGIFLEELRSGGLIGESLRRAISIGCKTLLNKKVRAKMTLPQGRQEGNLEAKLHILTMEVECTYQCYQGSLPLNLFLKTTVVL